MSEELSAPSVDATAEVRDTRLGRFIEIGARTKISESALDDYSYICNDCDVIYTSIGKFCSIAAQVRINPGNHPLQRAALHHFTYRAAQYGLGDNEATFFNWRRGFPVTLGHDVWIGHGAVVLPGISIGTGAAIAASAVVTKDVAPFMIVAGIPAKPLRQRFPDSVCEALLRISWWDWSHDQLRKALNDFRRMDAADFAGAYDPGS